MTNALKAETGPINWGQGKKTGVEKPQQFIAGPQPYLLQVGQMSHIITDVFSTVTRASNRVVKTSHEDTSILDASYRIDTGCRK